MIVFLIIWLMALTALTAIGFVMVIGKFVKLERAVDGALGKIYDDIEETHAVVDVFLEGFRNVQPDLENLLTKVKTLEENPSEVLQHIEQLETRFSDLTENLENLRGDINLLLRADKEHPVLAPANKGGRPRKGDA